MHKSFYLFLLLLFIAACKEKEPEATPQPKGGNLVVSVEHEVQGQQAEYGTIKYTNAAGNQFSIDLVQYFVSNFRVRNINGNWKDMTLYRLVKHNSEASRIIKLELPFAEYDSISFYIGVDSVTNHLTNNTGDLDPSSGLFWPWEGYIFYMFEGKFQKGSNPLPFAYHIGTDSYLMKYALPLPSGTKLEAKAGDAAVKMKVDLAEIFESPDTINLDSVALVSHTSDEPALTLKLRNNLLNAIRFEP